MEIKKIEKIDIDFVIEVHKASFKDFFLTTLGEDFLFFFYDCIRKSDKGILLGVYNEGKLYGFCAASSISKGFYTKLIINNFFGFTKIGLILLLTKFPSLIRLIKNLSKFSSNIRDDRNYAEILSIGVSPESQGKGIGKEILFYLENELKFNNSLFLSLTTDFYNNEKTLKFYKSLGYDVYYDFIAYPNRKMYKLIKKL
jgi:ribosomal protein S18 acetylase RimI-like enzyme